MPTQLSYRVLVGFFITAILMNVSNYYFYSYHQQPVHASQTTIKVNIPSKLIFKYDPTRIKTVKKETVSTVSELWTITASTLTQSTEDTLSIDKTYNYTDSSEIVFTAVPKCAKIPPNLGPIPSIPGLINRAATENRFAEVLLGGIYSPLECEARFNVAVILPYRGLKEYLTPIIYFLHAFLIRQQLSYRIFVVGYEDNLAIFNRGELFNIGFIEAQRQRPRGWWCIVFQDVHLVPKDLRNLYRCGRQPRQLVTAVERTHKPPYVPTFGGAVALTPGQFKKVNGFSNHFWEPDFDYDDLYRRLLSMNYTIERSKPSIGKYKTMRVIFPDNKTIPCHNLTPFSRFWPACFKLKDNQEVTHHYAEVLSSSLSRSPKQHKQRKLRYLADGLTTIIYKVDNMTLESMYTHIHVSVHTIDRVDPNGNISEALYSSVMLHTERYY